jgi:hypothetical protein
MGVTVYGSKSRVSAITVEGSHSHAAADEASHAQHAGTVRSCHHRRRPIGGGANGVRLARSQVVLPTPKR